MESIAQADCNKCNYKEFYSIMHGRDIKVSKLARETFKLAKEQNIDIGGLVKRLIENYVQSEVSYAEHDMYCRCAYDKGLVE